MGQIQYTSRGRPSALGEILQLGGGIAGGILGGAAGAATGPGGAAMGAAAGANMGASLGGTVGNFIDPGKQGRQVGSIGSGGSQSAAMARRAAAGQQNNFAILQAAEQRLSELPEPLRQEYGPAIMQARYMEQRSRGIS